MRYKFSRGRVLWWWGFSHTDFGIRPQVDRHSQIKNVPSYEGTFVLNYDTKISYYTKVVYLRINTFVTFTFVRGIIIRS